MFYKVLSLVRQVENIKLAEREGFEPSRPVSQPTRLAGERLQPLGHLSARDRHSISQDGVVAILLCVKSSPGQRGFSRKILRAAQGFERGETTSLVHLLFSMIFR